MNDLDLVRALRADAPHPTALAPLDLGRGFTSTGRRPDARPGRRLGLVAAAAVLVAGLGGLVALQTGPGASPTEATVVLDHAATVVAADAAPRPADGQWLYYGGAHATPEQDDVGVTTRTWQTFDGARYADPSTDLSDLSVATIDPDLVARNETPRTMYDAAEALPSEPDALLAALADSDLAETWGDTEAARHYNAVVGVYGQGRLALVPTQVHADLLRALGTIPGVDVDRSAQPDLLGRPVVAVTLDQQDRYDDVRVRSELLLDPRTFAYLGTRTTALETGEVAAGHSDQGEPLTATVVAGETYREDAAVGPAAVDRVGDEVDPLTGAVTHHPVAR